MSVSTELAKTMLAARTKFCLAPFRLMNSGLFSLRRMQAGSGSTSICSSASERTSQVGASKEDCYAPAELFASVKHGQYEGQTRCPAAERVETSIRQCQTVANVALQTAFEEA